MSPRAKQRLERLIRDMEGGCDDQGQEVAPLSTLANTTSSVSLGLSDLAAESSEDDIQAPAGRTRVIEPEQKVLSLLQERRVLEARYEREMRQRDADVARLQAYINGELANLRQRQQEVEERAPLVSAQLADARAALTGDLMISSERAAQLRELPSDRLGLGDAVRLALHDGLQDLRCENERLRLAGDYEREAVQRLEAECARLRRDNARLAATAAERQADVEATISSLEARCSRLSSELEEAAVAVEVLRAKGRQYDELEAHADRMESEVARLKAVESTGADLRQRLQEAEEASRALEGRALVAEAERACLTRETEALKDQVSCMEAELASKENKIAELKRARADLYQKLHDSDEMGRKRDDGQLERELKRIQEAASRDTEAARRDAVQVADREVRLMREMKDSALDNAARLRSELRDMVAAHDAVVASSREERLRLDVRLAELTGEAKVKAYELQRVQVMCKERGAAVQKAHDQLEMMADKVRVLTASACALEADRDRSTSELQAHLDAAVAQLAQYEAAEAGLSCTVGEPGTWFGITQRQQQQQQAQQQIASNLGGDLSEAAQAAAGTQREDGACMGGVRRPLRALGLQGLSARCDRWEAEKIELQRSWREAEGKLCTCEADLAMARQRLAAVGQPQRFVLEQLAEAQCRANEAEAKAQAIQDALDARERAHAAAVNREGALKADLQRLLRERGTLDALRTLVAGALVKSSGTGNGGDGLTGNSGEVGVLCLDEQRQ